MSIERETPGIDFSRDWKKNNIFHQENIKFGHVTSDYRSCVPIFLLNKNIYWVFLWTCLFCFSFWWNKIKNNKKYIYLMRWTFFHRKLYTNYIFRYFVMSFVDGKQLFELEKCQIPTPFRNLWRRVNTNRKLVTYFKKILFWSNSIWNIM